MEMGPWKVSYSHAWVPSCYNHSSEAEGVLSKKRKLQRGYTKSDGGAK